MDVARSCIMHFRKSKLIRKPYWPASLEWSSRSRSEGSVAKTQKTKTQHGVPVMITGSANVIIRHDRLFPGAVDEDIPLDLLHSMLLGRSKVIFVEGGVRTI